MANANRDKGLRFEWKTALNFRLAGYKEAATTRAESKSMDDAGIDITNCGEWSPQCKSVKSAPNMHKLLKSMPGPGDKFGGGISVVLHHRNNEGTTVTMGEKDFFEIVKRLKWAEEELEEKDA
jgi:hypothetical protein